MMYNGWNITKGPEHPVTGRWRAERFGVTMCAGDEAAIKRMVDVRIAEEDRERAEREAAYEQEQAEADWWSRHTPAGGEM